MSRTAKIWLLCVSIGCILFGGVMSLLKWDFTKLATQKYETNEYAIAEAYKDVTILSDTADITFLPAGETRIVCYEHPSVKHTVSVADGTLTIRAVDERKWYEHIGIFFDSPKITVYLPGGEYGNLHIKESTGEVEIRRDFAWESVDITASTGDVACYASASGSVSVKTSTGAIRMEGLSTGALDLSVSTGRVSVSDVTCAGSIKIRVSTGRATLTDTTCRDLTSTGSTGDVHLRNVIAAGKISIERDTGDVTFDGCDGAEITVKTDTGDVRGSLLSDKIFFAQSDTGRVRVPKTTSGGRCEIDTDTGNVDIRIGK